MFDLAHALLLLVLLISLAGNAFLAHRLHSHKPPTFYDARALSADLDRYDKALIKIQRVDPEDVVLRSPRDRR